MRSVSHTFVWSFGLDSIVGGTHMLKNTFPVSTRNPYDHPNQKWIARDPKSVSNRVPIRKTYFELPDGHNPDMGIFPPENPFAEMILFWIFSLEKMSNRY